MINKNLLGDYPHIVDMAHKYHHYTILVNSVTEKDYRPELLSRAGNIDLINQFLPDLLLNVNNEEKEKVMNVLTTAFYDEAFFEEVSAIIELYLLKNKNKNENENENENKNVEFIGIGNFSIVFRFGDKVLKIGNDIFKEFKQVYHPRMMMPYFRKLYRNNIKVEILDLANVKSKDITDDTPLEVYLDMEKDDLDWTDAKKENLGQALKDNKWPDWLKSDTLDIMGLESDITREEWEKQKLKKGDIGVIDLQHVYHRDFEDKYGDVITDPKVEQHRKEIGLEPE